MGFKRYIFNFVGIFLISYSLLAAEKTSVNKILILGDSLTEGYGVDQQFSYPSQLERILKENKLNYRVINAGLAGSTTASGLSRLKWYFKGKPTILIIALGANDGLRGLPIDSSYKNLEQMILYAKKMKVKTIIASMQMPPNYGKEYRNKFKNIYQQLAGKYHLIRIPFLLENVAGRKELNIEDGVHPNSAGHKIIALTVYKYLKEIL